MQKLWLLLAGEYAEPALFPQKEDSVIAVDGGIRHAQRLHLTPDLWIGDFDSADVSMSPDLPRHTYPQDKDKTDFELALSYAQENYPNHIYHVIGSAGKEADHAFANLWVLAQVSAPVVLWQKYSTIVHAQGGINICWQSDIGSKISLFALTPLYGVNGSGLRWTLNDATILPHRACAARNEMCQRHASLSWQSGCGLLFLPTEIELSVIFSQKNNKDTP